MASNRQKFVYANKQTQPQQKEEQVMFTTTTLEAAFYALERDHGLNWSYQKIQKNIEIDRANKEEALIIGALDELHPESGFSIVRMTKQFIKEANKVGADIPTDHKFLIRVIKNTNNISKMLTRLVWQD